MAEKKPGARRLLEGMQIYSILAVLTGVIILMIVSKFSGGTAADRHGSILLDLGREFGALLVSVFGVSYLYEKLSAERNFERFHQDLERLVRQGESNAAMCASLGILELHASRKSYEARHNFATELSQLGPGDSVRIVGRSLIFAMYAWNQFQTMLRQGARLELCLFDPEIRESPLNYLAGYSAEETRFAIHRFISSVQPWLLAEEVPGTLEVRLHDLHLLDSMVQIQHGPVNRIAWDLNFGEGTETRYVVVVDGEGRMGASLAKERYTMIWERAAKVYRYADGAVTMDKLSRQGGGQDKLGGG